ncbi:hypothetical protein Q7P37_009507 [Cladosporium fusiforme]
MQASNCDRCYRRKGRCDKQQPCSSCAQANVTCTYTDKLRQRRYTSDDIERVEKRLRQSEARNRSLLDEVTRLKAGSEHPGTSPAETEKSHATDVPRRADAVSEVSYLSINAAGERQPFLGSTSGILFADLVRSSVDASVSRHGTPPASAAATQGGQSPISTSNFTKRKQELPPETLASKLMKSYFEHDAIAFPFLSPTTLLEMLEKFYRDDFYYSSQASPYEVFVFNMTLAIATASVYKYDWQMLPSAESHHARAMQELDHVLAIGGLESLQAILLLCQYRQGSSIKDNSASMWHLVGIAARICLELGLHRESAYPRKYTPELDSAALSQYLQREVARRCFWCLIAMDRVTSNILGRPLAIRDEDIDSMLPSDRDDAENIYPSAMSISVAPRTAVFNTIINYRLLCGRILTTLHRRRAPSMTTTDALKLRDGLAQSLEGWQSQVHQLGLADETASDPSQRSCYLSPVWFRVLHANARLNIWRPCPLLADLSHDQHSLQNIYESSIQAITAYSALHKSRKINYSWIALQSIFMAGLSFLYSVSRHFREQRNHSTSIHCCLLEKDPQAIDISQISRACSNVMVAVAERWNALRHCREVFDRLSDAVLADALKMQTQPAHLPPSRVSPSIAESHVLSSTNTLERHHTLQDETNRASVNASTNTLYWNGQQQPRNMGAPTSQLSLAVDNEFLNSYDDLQSMYLNQVEDPVMHLSQDWLGYLGGADGLFDQHEEFNGNVGMFQ